MSTVIIQKIATGVQWQLMLQCGIKIHRVDTSISWWYNKLFALMVKQTVYYATCSVVWMMCISRKSPSSWLNSSVTSHAIQLTDSFDTDHQLIISCVTSYFDVYSLSIAEYEDVDILRCILQLKTSMGSNNRWMFKMWDLYVRSLRLDKHPCHSSKGNFINQHHYLVLTGLWCHWCHGWW